MGEDAHIHQSRYKFTIDVPVNSNVTTQKQNQYSVGTDFLRTENKTTTKKRAMRDSSRRDNY